MAGMIPLIKIQHQTTVVGSCLSMLRQVSDESQISEYHCIVHVLCIWNRGADVLELTREWLDEAFRSQRLNESFCVSDLMPLFSVSNQNAIEFLLFFFFSILEKRIYAIETSQIC